MSLRDRAGQFAPFSALLGLHAAAGRTEERATQYKEYSLRAYSLTKTVKIATILSMSGCGTVCCAVVRDDEAAGSNPVIPTIFINQ